MRTLRHPIRVVLGTIGVVAGMSAVTPLRAQTGGTCVPVSQRVGRDLGCFITAREELGRLPKDPPLFWHLDRYLTRAKAEEAKAAHGTVVESLGFVWLFTIAPKEWRPTAGERVAQIGPLPLVEADQHAAVYMEGVFKPGMQSQIHRHPGAEAWYTLEGSMCLETPEGTLTQRAGDPGVWVRAGPPMVLTGTGTATRRSLVLILQDASAPRSIVASDWTPKGLCVGIPSGQFQFLSWLEGRWRGTGTSPALVFFERYRRINDTTIASISYGPDSTLKQPRESSVIVLDKGHVFSRGGDAEWVAQSLASDSVRFEPSRNASNSFTWLRLGPDTWRATLRWRNDKGEARERVFSMRRL